MAPKSIVFSVFLFFSHLVCAILIGAFGRYGDSAMPSPSKNETADSNTTTTTKRLFNHMSIYTSFQDVQGMLFLGFGFLMTFLRRYGFSSLGLNMMISVLAIEWATVVNGLFHLDANRTFTIDVNSMIAAEFTTATVLISFGALLGKCSPLQLVLLTLIEIPLMVVNEYIGRYIFKAVDAGDSIFVHAFGAYFGIACARVMCKKSMTSSEKEGSIYHSDMFSMIGTLLLWIYWPSFNGGTAENDAQHRAFINTFFSLVAATITTFIVSCLISEEGKFEMVHVQNATLAGGVAVGTCADFVLYPWGAIIIGTLAGCLSTIGFTFITPALNKRLFHDTCGVNNLHGLPAILAAILSVIYAGTASATTYGEGLFTVFPARKDSRSAGAQAGFQLAALVLTLLISILCGALTGLLLRWNVWDNLSKSNYFDDKRFWTVPANETYTIIRDSKSPEQDDDGNVADSGI